MANADEVRAEILDPMRSLYRVPFGIENPEGALVQYAAVLHRYRTATLSAGWKRFIVGYTRRDWPSISDLIAVMEAVEREDRTLSEQRMRAAQTPDPYEAFTKAVLVFVKRNERTFCDFRDAGVRAVIGQLILRFDDEAAATSIRETYGAELDAFIGYHVPIEAEDPAAANAEWRYPKWPKDKLYNRPEAA